MNTTMGTPDLTVQVLNLSPRVTLQDLVTFFSYCGTVHQVQLLRDKDKLPYGLVTFVQPYAFQTALLLDDVIFAGQPICILPLYDRRIPIVSDDDIDHTQTRNQGIIPAANILKQCKEDLDEKLKMSSEKGRVLMEQKKSVIYTVEQVAGRVGTAIMNNNCILTGASRLSDVLTGASRLSDDVLTGASRLSDNVLTGASRLADVFDKASRSASELGIRKRAS